MFEPERERERERERALYMVFHNVFRDYKLYNKKTEGPTLMELFTATKKLIFFFFFDN